MNNLRLFFAIAIPKLIQDILSEYIEPLEKIIGANQIRWTIGDHLHVTLQFMQSVQNQHLSQLIETTRVAVQNLHSFELEFGAPELFPSLSHPRFITLNAEHNQELSQLAACVGHCITDLGYPIEQRPYRGHLTLGRLVSSTVSNDALKWINVPKTPKILVNEFHLIESKPSQGKSTYSSLARFKLQD